MIFSAPFVSLALLVSSVLGAPNRLLSVERYDGETSGRYIVTLKADTVKSDHLSWVNEAAGAGANITHDWNPDFVNGYAANLDDDALRTLRASPDVESIGEDGVVSIKVTETNAPWGIARLSSTSAISGSDTANSYTYTYNSAAGSGVDIYVIDTGIYTSHSDFGGRARWGATFGGYADADGNGHGTHVSGTAAGTRWGVAKAANLIAVKVLSDSGSGSVSDIVSGLDWVATQVSSSGRPSIATLSLGGSASTTLDNAVTSLVNQGIHVTVAAGNSNTDASSSSPARATAVNTIGATTIADARASYSNYGSVVDIFAPGTDVTSSWIGSTTATNTISGTSMATPHVAGLLAYLISVNGNSSPASLTSTLKGLGLSGVLTGIPSGTVNLLAHNDQ